MTSELSQEAWDEFLSSHPQAHILQTSAWGELKASFGWSVRWWKYQGLGAQILVRQLAPGIKLGYIPMGPIGDLSERARMGLIEFASTLRLSILKIEPDEYLTESGAVDKLQNLGFRASNQSIQPRRTLVVDISSEEEDILARMNQKTRYNIRLADRKGVAIRPWDDVQSFSNMVQETAARDDFGAHNTAYYQKAYNLFKIRDECELFVAEVEDEPLAAVMVFSRGERAWYLFGASTGRKRNLMPNYLLQWEAMKWARRQGCRSYDLWGVPDYDQETLEANFTKRNDELWGVYRFKRGFGGELVRTLGAWDYPLHSLKFRTYSLAVRLLKR